MEKIYFRANGYIIEFHKFDRYLVFYNIKKILSFLLDILLYGLFISILIFVFKTSLVLSFLYSYLIFLVLMISQLFLLKNKTIGLLVAGLIIGSYDGEPLLPGKFIIRAFLLSLYTIPFLGIILVLTSLLTMFLGKGITIVDIASRTQVYSKQFYKNVNYIMNRIEKN